MDRGNVSRLSEFYAKNFTADYPFPDWGEGLEGLSALVSKLRKDFSGYNEHIEELLISDKKVIAVLSISFNHPTTNEQISFRHITIITVDKEKIIHQRGLTDLFSLYSKLDMIDQPHS